jgi:FkbM family methyltransferase
MRNPTSWLLKESEGLTILDKCTLFLVKVSYLASRILLRIALGKKRRDRLYIKQGMDFGLFWNKAFNYLRLGDKTTLLKFRSKKYGYEFCCRNNKDDFKVMSIHEDEIIEHFILKEGDIVVDIGAHIGLYTIIASKHVGLKGKVVAIEAEPGNFEILTSNTKLNQLTNVISLNSAVSSKEGKVKLYMPYEELGHTKYHSIMLERVGEAEKTFVEVNANTLDNLLPQNGIEEVNWIKIDVEGAEYEVLKGAAKSLSKSKEIALLIEIHNLGGINFYQQIIDFLRSYGFKIEFEKSYEGGERHVIVRKS